MTEVLLQNSAEFHALSSLIAIWAIGVFFALGLLVRSLFTAPGSPTRGRTFHLVVGLALWPLIASLALLALPLLCMGLVLLLLDRTSPIYLPVVQIFVITLTCLARHVTECRKKSKCRNHLGYYLQG